MIDIVELLLLANRPVYCIWSNLRPLLVGKLESWKGERSVESFASRVGTK